MWETRVWFLGQEDPLEKEMAIHSSTLAWKIPWTEEPDRLQSTGSQRVGHDFTFTFTIFISINIIFCLAGSLPYSQLIHPPQVSSYSSISKLLFLITPLQWTASHTSSLPSDKVSAEPWNLVHPYKLQARQINFKVVQLQQRNIRAYLHWNNEAFLSLGD